MTIDWDEKRALLQEPNIAAVTQLCDELMAKRPGSSVPYIDPVHDEDECRIVTLQTSPGRTPTSGFVSHLNDDDAARRAQLIYDSAELDVRYVMPWNCYPWVRDAELPPALSAQEKTDGLRPFRQFLKINKRVSAVVAHGAETAAFLALFEKTYHSPLRQHGIKVYKASALGGRAFALSEAKQQELLAKNIETYRDAMQRAGIQHL
ncbi:uracil-DNA glycosylase [Arthrobacter sp. MA-N2]|uniref:uracil-DNA glycosylase n=1 Tax=Arthrobacter sp. MA-N2 TaxID=1101188 RepID=UPI000482B139|nr:uracil-DNA glycosylase [Arthrobacter sp. MA-N2]